MGVYSITLHLFIFEDSNNKKVKNNLFLLLLDWSVQKIVEECIVQVYLTEGDRAESQHILHRDFHLHVCFTEMVQLTTIEVKI